MLAKEMQNHVTIVGYTHLGARITEHLRKHSRPYVLIDKEAWSLDELVRQGEPVLVDVAKQESTLMDAGIERARPVVITSNAIETALLVTKRARDHNQKVQIIVRCYLDEFAEILETLEPTRSFPARRAPLPEFPRTSIRSVRPARRVDFGAIAT